MKRKLNLNRWLVLCLAALCLFAAGCRQKEKPANNINNNMPEVVPVKVMEVEKKTLRVRCEFVGNILSFYEAEVYPKVSGKIMEKVKDEGQIVAQNEVIMYIDRDEVGLTFEKAPVESPLSGLIGRVYVDIGQQVTPNTPVARVVNIEKVKINVDIPETFLANIGPGQDADITVDTYPDKIFHGKINKISPVLDVSTRTTPAEIIIENSNMFLKPGMFARVSLVTEVAENVPVIFTESIIGKNSESYVYIVENDAARKRKISLGLREGHLREVKSGVNPGELVVVMGQQKLTDGVKVLFEKMEQQ